MSRDEYTDTDRIVGEIRDVETAIENLDLPSLRDRFAMAAMQSIMVIGQPSHVTPAMMAKAAYDMADEMIKARG